MPKGPITVKKSGTSNFPWEARCFLHADRKDYIYTHPIMGAAAFNTHGIGNRTWGAALYAAMRHYQEFHNESRTVEVLDYGDQY